MHPDEYRKLAELEDRLWHFEVLHGHVRRAVQMRFPDGPQRLLDAGCGTGGLLRRAKSWWPAAEVTGVDVEPLALDYARRRTPGVRVEEGSVTALPFAAQSFDVIVSVDVLCNVEQPSAAVAEFARCLRPGGVLILNLPAYRWLWSYHDDAVHSLHRFRRNEVARILRAAGFGAVDATYWNSLILPLVAVRRKLLRPPAGGSDVVDYPRWLQHLLRGLNGLENAWIGAGGRWAWGTSVFAVASKSLAGSGRETV